MSRELLVHDLQCEWITVPGLIVSRSSPKRDCQLKACVYQSRRFITLLEILIVVGILALVGGLVSIGINRAVDEQKFRAEVDLIIEQLRLAQDLMLILGTDVYVVFSKDVDSGKTPGIKYELELETLLSPNMEREILRRHGNLKKIKGVFFYDTAAKEYTPGKIKVRFQSKGAVMSKGVMRLATTDDENPPQGTLQTFICLPGYPKPIISEDDEEKAKECNLSLESADDLKLTQDMMSKLSDLFKSDDASDSKNAEEQPAQSEPSSSQSKAKK